MICTRTPLRISIIGGGTDMPEFFNAYRGVVVSFTINKYIYVFYNKKFDGKVRVSYSVTENVEMVNELKNDIIRETLLHARIHNNVEIATMADIPGKGSGLGSSSAVIVGLLTAITSPANSSWTAETAYSIERDMARKPVGKQDHYAAAIGGMNMFHFSKNSSEYIQLSSFQELEDHMLLLWTGMTRTSSDILESQAHRFKAGETLKEGEELVILAEKCREAIIHQDIIDIADILEKGWQIKKRLSPWISNSFIDNWLAIAKDCGAFGGKLCGAGGSGFLFIIAPPDSHQKIVDKTGLKKINFKLVEKGSETVYVG